MEASFPVSFVSVNFDMALMKMEIFQNYQKFDKNRGRTPL